MHKHEKTFLELKDKLADFDHGCLNPGVYECGFAFRIPEGCPSSFFFKKKHHDQKPEAKTKYTIEAKLEVKGEDFKYKSTLCVREPAEVFDANINKRDRDPIVTWCCCSQGHSEMKTVFEKNNFMPHEVARATVNVDNSDCKLDCNQVKMDIILEIKMNVEGRHFHYQESLKGAHDTKTGPKAGEKDW